MLWEAIGGADTGVDLGFCFDTCHAHAAGEELGDAVERILAITGRIDLLHANDSRDPPGTGADRHERLGEGKLDPDALRAMIRAGAEAGAAVIVETPRTPDGLRRRPRVRPRRDRRRLSRGTLKPTELRSERPVSRRTRRRGNSRRRR